ncbi:MAG: hypothetical protein ACLSUZ_01350 [Bifidobacterium pseudocatenulatum]
MTTGADNGQGWSIDGTFQCVTDFYDDKDNGTDEYIENVVDQITFNIDGSEEKCGVPMGYAPTAVWYNTDMWESAGLTDADYPQTWMSCSKLLRSSPSPMAPSTASLCRISAGLRS